MSHAPALPTLLLCTTLLVGCRPPEAPDTIEEMMLYGFDNYDQEDPTWLVNLGDKLVPWLDSHMEEAAEGFEINALTADNLATAGLDVPVTEGIIGAVVGLDYAIPLDRLGEGLSHLHQETIFQNYLEFERDVQVSRDCFLARECEFFDTADEIHSDVGFLGIEMWSTLTASLRWVELSDGTRALAHRHLGPDPVQFNVDWMSVHQQYSFTFSYERPDGSARRAQAIWVEGEVISDDVSEGALLGIGISAIHNAAEDMEAWGQDPTAE